MKFVTKIIAGCALLLSVARAEAQTLLINPHTDGGFEMGSTFAANGWTLVNNTGSVGNNWFIRNGALNNAGSSFTPTDNQVAYISQSANGSSWSYDINEYSTTHFYKDVSFPVGQSIIRLNFRWNAKGEGNNNQAYDVLYVYVCPTSLTPVPNSPFGTSSNPSAWIGTGTASLLGAFHSCSQPGGTTASLALPPGLAGTTARLVFTWKNGNTLGVQPPAAIDSIALRTDCPQSTISINNLSAPCSNQINLSTTLINSVSGGTYQWYRNNNLISGATNASYSSSALLNGDVMQCVYYTNNVCGYTDTATITIQYSPPAAATEYLELCPRQLPYVWRGITIPAGTTSNPNYTTLSIPQPGACDSIITLNLHIDAAPTKTERISTCRNQLIHTTWRGQTLPADAQSNSRFDSVYVPNPSGGCDSIIYLDLQVTDNAITEINTIQGCDQIVYQGKTYTESTDLTDTFINASGCDSLYRITRLEVRHFTIALNMDISQPVAGEWIHLTTTSTEARYDIRSWSPASLFADQYAHSQYIRTPELEVITVSAQNDQGCTDTATLQITGSPFSRDFMMPNAFTPNGDGRNDLFAPVFRMNRSYQIITFEIYNRWGNKVFGSYQAGDKGGWDGYIGGHRAAAGVYYYHIVIHFSDGSKVEKSGDVSLIY